MAGPLPEGSGPPLLDIYSPDGRNIGLVDGADIFHATGMWHAAVHCWVRSGDLLLVRRHTTPPLDGLLGPTITRHVAAGHTTTDTLAEALNSLRLPVDGDHITVGSIAIEHDEDANGIALHREHCQVTIHHHTGDLGDLAADMQPMGVDLIAALATHPDAASDAGFPSYGTGYYTQLAARL